VWGFSMSKKLNPTLNGRISFLITLINDKIHLCKNIKMVWVILKTMAH